MKRIEKAGKAGQNAKAHDYTSFTRKSPSSEPIVTISPYGKGEGKAIEIVEEYRKIFAKINVPFVKFEKLYANKNEEFVDILYIFKPLIKKILNCKSDFGQGEFSPEAARVLAGIGVEMPLDNKEAIWMKNLQFWKDYVAKNDSWAVQRRGDVFISDKLNWIRTNLARFNEMESGGHKVHGKKPLLTDSQYNEMELLKDALDAKGWPPNRARVVGGPLK